MDRKSERGNYGKSLDGDGDAVSWSEFDPLRATPRGRWAPRCSRGPAIEGLLSDQDHYYGTLKEGVAVTLMLRKGLGARGQVRFGRKERLRGEGKEGNGNELQRHRKKQYVIGLRRE